MLVKEIQTIHRIGSFQELHYRADQENLGALFHILRNQLYSNKLEAVIREYSTNAADIHTETDQSRPFEVYLPTKINPTLRIRDFGTGLSMGGIQDYISMGKSDKRNSPLLNGCLGIGCKSGFAYTDTFDIISRYENERIDATSFVDESREGRLIITRHEALGPDEEHGLEVIIPIREEDFVKCRDTALEVLGAFTFPPLLFQGKQELKIKSRVTGNPIQLLLGDKTPTHEILSGNVAYPLDPTAAGIEVPPNCKIILEMPLGSFAFSASRESVEYTKESKDGIKAHLAQAKDSLATKANAYLDRFENPWTASVAAWRKIRQETARNRVETYRKLQALDSLQWRGIPLPSHNQLAGYPALLWKNPQNPDLPGKWEIYIQAFHPPQKTLVVLPVAEGDPICVSKTRRKICPKRDPWILPALTRAREENFQYVLVILHSKLWSPVLTPGAPGPKLPNLAPKPCTLLAKIPQKGEQITTPRKWKGGYVAKAPVPKYPLIKFETYNETNRFVWADVHPTAQKKNPPSKVLNQAKRGKELSWWKNVRLTQFPDVPPRILCVGAKSEWNIYRSTDGWENHLFGENVILVAHQYQPTKSANKITEEEKIREALKAVGIETVQEAWQASRPKTLVCHNDRLIKLLQYLGPEAKQLKGLENLYVPKKPATIRHYQQSLFPPSRWVDKEQQILERKIWEKLVSRFPLLKSLDLKDDTDKKAVRRYLKLPKQG